MASRTVAHDQGADLLQMKNDSGQALANTILDYGRACASGDQAAQRATLRACFRQIRPVLSEAYRGAR